MESHRVKCSEGEQMDHGCIEQGRRAVNYRWVPGGETVLLQCEGLDQSLSQHRNDVFLLQALCPGVFLQVCDDGRGRTTPYICLQQDTLDHLELRLQVQTVVGEGATDAEQQPFPRASESTRQPLQALSVYRLPRLYVRGAIRQSFGELPYSHS